MLHDRIKSAPGVAANGGAATTGRIDLPTPYLLFLGDCAEAGYAKTAQGLKDWAPEKCVGEFALPEASVTTGLPRLTPAEAAAKGARSIVIGIANSGGFISPAWIPALVEALEAGLDIVAGMHMRLNDHPELAAKAAQLGRQLFDVRVPPPGIPIGTGVRRTGKRLLTVGTDCALGKKYTCAGDRPRLQGARRRCRFPRHRPDRDHDRRQRHSDGRGRRRLRRRRRRGAEPRRRARSLGRDRGPGLAAPPVLFRRVAGDPARQPARRHRRLSRSDRARPCSAIPEYPLPSVAEMIELNLRLGARTNPNVRCGGVTINTSALSEEEAAELLDRESVRLGLPVADPMRGGSRFERLIDRCLG